MLLSLRVLKVGQEEKSSLFIFQLWVVIGIFLELDAQIDRIDSRLYIPETQFHLESLISIFQQQNDK